jgi:outer membrane protein OmpA-like peptidoglycan-associated protein
MFKLSILRQGLSLLIIALVLFLPITWAEDIRATLFNAADEARSAAQAANADYLAPKSYDAGQKYYVRAEQRLEKGSSVESIKADLDKATQYFQTATKATDLANLTLPDAIKARSDAISAESSKYAPSEWKKADDVFRRAAIQLENGDINDARSNGDRAQNLYREAELIAIKANYLGGAKALLQQAKKDGAHKYAPKTYAKAESLIAEAEKSLTESRYDTDVPRSLAKEAKYKTAHSIYITSFISESRSKDLSTEDLILDWESPITQIGTSLGMSVMMDKGYQPATDKILQEIAKLQASDEDAKQLRLQVQRLEKELGGKSKLVQAEKKRREQLAELSRLFTPNEAQILREGNHIILRMIGLSFAFGKYDIQSQYFGLLKKVQDAIQVFPGSQVVVEGHTDSFGADEANLNLSKKRSESVRTYLIANLGMPASSVKAVGYGETRPIANNETADGRAKNRRIDIVIHPKQ